MKKIIPFMPVLGVILIAYSLYFYDDDELINLEKHGLIFYSSAIFQGLSLIIVDKYLI